MFYSAFIFGNVPLTFIVFSAHFAIGYTRPTPQMRTELERKILWLDEILRCVFISLSISFLFFFINDLNSEWQRWASYLRRVGRWVISEVVLSRSNIKQIEWKKSNTFIRVETYFNPFDAISISTISHTHYTLTNFGILYGKIHTRRWERESKTKKKQKSRRMHSISFHSIPFREHCSIFSTVASISMVFYLLYEMLPIPIFIRIESNFSLFSILLLSSYKMSQNVFRFQFMPNKYRMEYYIVISLASDITKNRARRQREREIKRETKNQEKRIQCPWASSSKKR